MAKRRRTTLDMMSTIRVQLTYVCVAVVDKDGTHIYPCPMWVLRGIGALGEGGISPRNFWVTSIGQTAFLTEEEMEQVTEIAGHNGIDVIEEEEMALHLEDSPHECDRGVTVEQWLDQQEKRWADIQNRRHP